MADNQNSTPEQPGLVASHAEYVKGAAQVSTLAPGLEARGILLAHHVM